jgi:hypothetical protein
LTQKGLAREMALNNKCPKHEEGTISVEGRLPGRGKKNNPYKGLFNIVLMDRGCHEISPVIT